MGGKQKRELNGFKKRSISSELFYFVMKRMKVLFVQVHKYDPLPSQEKQTRIPCQILNDSRTLDVLEACSLFPPPVCFLNTISPYTIQMPKIEAKKFNHTKKRNSQRIRDLNDRNIHQRKKVLNPIEQNC